MQILTSTGFAEQTITKSRFNAGAFYAEDEHAVSATLRALLAQHHNAHHLAYAFRVKTSNGIVQRFSDAGEPSGTAGMPILKLLEGRDLINVCIGVIRYYGGVNLGTGGLARAYGSTAKMALDAAKTAPYVEMQQVHLKIQYKQMDALTHALAKCNGSIINKAFKTEIELLIMLPAEEVIGFTGRFSSPY